MSPREILDNCGGPECYRGCAWNEGDICLVCARAAGRAAVHAERHAILALAESPGATVESLVKAIKERG